MPGPSVALTRGIFPKTMKSSISRRQLLQTSLFSALSPAVMRGQSAGGKKLRVGFVGMGGQIQGHVARVLELGHEVTAFCDVDVRQVEASRQRHGAPVAGAAAFEDYRKLLSDAPVDAVVIATPDHWHAPVCRAAMEAGKHIYCEKPLTHTLAEARELRELAKRSKVITQTGNQGSSSANLRRSMELIAAGFFGEIADVHVWHPAHSWPSGRDRDAGSDPVPAGLNWDRWLGPAPERPYKSTVYHPGQWRGWYDFGNGSLGDFCCHGFNLPVRALQLDYPDRIEISGKGMGHESFAQSCTVRYRFPARQGRGPVRLNFYTGGDLPADEVTARLRESTGSLPSTGCLMIGEKGQLQCGLWNSDGQIRLAADSRFAWFGQHKEAVKVPESLPRSKGQIDEWIDAILGGPPVFADFNHGGHLTEIGLAGIVALRLQKDIDWDGEGMKVPGNPEADRFIRPVHRPI